MESESNQNEPDEAHMRLSPILLYLTCSLVVPTAAFSHFSWNDGRHPTEPEQWESNNKQLLICPQATRYRVILRDVLLPQSRLGGYSAPEERDALYFMCELLLFCTGSTVRK